MLAPRAPLAIVVPALRLHDLGHELIGTRLRDGYDAHAATAVAPIAAAPAPFTAATAMPAVAATTASAAHHCAAVRQSQAGSTCSSSKPFLLVLACGLCRSLSLRRSS